MPTWHCFVVRRVKGVELRPQLRGTEQYFYRDAERAGDLCRSSRVSAEEFEDVSSQLRERTPTSILIVLPSLV